jgi:hypothetical protein
MRGAEVLGFCVKFFNIVTLVFVSNDELPGFLERNVVCLTSLVKKLSSTDA